MFHISKQNVAIRMQVKHLLNVKYLEIVLLITMNKLFRKPALVRKHLFFLALVSYSFFLSYIGKWPFKYVC